MVMWPAAHALRIAPSETCWNLRFLGGVEHAIS
jgi:hypothetical protein